MLFVNMGATWNKSFYLIFISMISQGEPKLLFWMMSLKIILALVLSTGHCKSVSYENDKSTV